MAREEKNTCWLVLGPKLLLQESQITSRVLPTISCLDSASHPRPLLVPLWLFSCSSKKADKWPARGKDLLLRSREEGIL